MRMAKIGLGNMQDAGIDINRADVEDTAMAIAAVFTCLKA